MNTVFRPPLQEKAGKRSAQSSQKSHKAAFTILTYDPISTIIAPGEYFISPAMP
jgi:hypothetical protein